MVPSRTPSATFSDTKVALSLADLWLCNQHLGGGPVAGFHSSLYPVSMTDRVKGLKSPMWCMVANQYSRWARSLPSGESQGLSSWVASP